MVALKERPSPPIPAPAEFNPVADIVAAAEQLRKKIAILTKHRDCRRVLLGLLDDHDGRRKEYAEDIKIALQSVMFAVDSMKLALDPDFGGREWFENAVK